jgi:hypothetical protein
VQRSNFGQIADDNGVAAALRMVYQAPRGPRTAGCPREVPTMMKTVTTLTAAAALAVALTAAPTDAFAQRRGSAAPFSLGGIAAGAIIGGALAAPRYYEPAPVYVAPAQRCYADQEVWSNRRQAYVVRRMIVPCY